MARISNSAYEDRWTCPECYHDHRDMVTECAMCGEKLHCTIEMEPVPYCMSGDDLPEDDGDD